MRESSIIVRPEPIESATYTPSSRLQAAGLAPAIALFEQAAADVPPRWCWSSTDDRTDPAPLFRRGGPAGNRSGMQDDQTAGDQQHTTEAPEVTEEHKEKAAEMAKSYDDQRPTAVMPGTDRTITGTAVNEWLDDEGNPKYGDPEESPHANDTPPETQEPPD